MATPSRSLERFLTSIFSSFARTEAIGRASATGGLCLDVGIGSGETLPSFALNVSVVGVEHREPLLRLAAERLGRRPVSRVAGLVQALPWALPFEDGTFDTAMATFALGETAQPSQVLDELVRVTRPTGEVIVIDRFAGARELPRFVGPPAASVALSDLVARNDVSISAMRRLRPMGLFTLVCLRVESAPGQTPQTAAQRLHLGSAAGRHASHRRLTRRLAGSGRRRRHGRRRLTR